MATRAGLGRKTIRRAKPAVNEEHHDLILQSDRHHELTGGWLAGREPATDTSAIKQQHVDRGDFLRHRRHGCLVSTKTNISVGEAAEITFRILWEPGADASHSFGLRQLGCVPR